MTDTRQSSAMLAQALDIPSLNHNNPKGNGGGESSSSSSSGSPSAVTPQEFDEMEENDKTRSPPPNETQHVRSISGFDTPITSNYNKTSVTSRVASIQSIGESSLNTNSSEGSSFIRFDDIPRHSDYTIPVSNHSRSTLNSTGSNTEEPPLGIQSSSQKRSILGNMVGKKYHVTEGGRRNMIPTHNSYGSIPPPMAVVTTPHNLKQAMTPLSSESASFQQEQTDGPPTTALHKRSASRMIPRVLPAQSYNPDYEDYYDDIVDDQACPNAEFQDLLPKTSTRKDFRKSVHAQSLLVGVAFMVVWLPNNAMAPNLTQMADFFGMTDAERDLYLGSYCALALGVFCLPISGLIGFMADFYSRKDLFLACCVLGALTSVWTGWSPNFWNLFLARLCSGGCMSGSVSVAFSLMGDLFSKEERNAASSGLTSMMGMGIILGQVYAGEVGPSKSWQYPFFVSASIQLAMAVAIFLWVEEPVRGGTEKALEGVFKSGNKYEKQLTMDGFIELMSKNESNGILIWQGFLTSLPWGIVFVFLNDFLSQEKGFTVEEATFLVMLFGVGCAVGGISGGYLGQVFMKGNRSHLPIYMATTTFLGIFPFLALLNSNFATHNGIRGKIYSILGGCIANLPSVNVRPCILNVNPPEARGAALTTANLMVTLGRGVGPSCVTLLGSLFSASRQTSFNITLSLFWTISAIQLLFLANTLPRDQDVMEEELARYAACAQEESNSTKDIGDEERQAPMSPLRNASESDLLQPKSPDRLDMSREDENFYDSIINTTPGQYMAIDGKSARESLEFVKLGIQEFGDEFALRNLHCGGCDSISPCESHEDVRKEDTVVEGTGEVLFSQEETISEEEMKRRRDMWKRRQQQEQDDQQED